MRKNSKITVLLVDDHPIFLNGLAPLIRKINNVVQVITANGGEEAITAYHKHPPDIVFMDLQMKPMDGYEAMRQILAAHGDAKIVVLSMHDDFFHIHKAMNAGIYGYLFKNVELPELEHCLWEVLQGRQYFTSEITKQLHSAINSDEMKSPYQKDSEKLSEREWQVLQYLISGYTHEQAGQALHLSHRTIGTYAKNIHAKLNTSAPYWLSAYAMENNIPPLPKPEKED